MSSTAQTKAAPKHKQGTIIRVRNIRKEYKNKYAAKHIDYKYSLEQLSKKWGYSPESLHQMIAGLGFYKNID